VLENIWIHRGVRAWGRVWGRIVVEDDRHGDWLRLENGLRGEQGSDVRLDPYWLNGMGWTLNFAGAEDGLVAE
jgi:hypothetical protein